VSSWFHDSLMISGFVCAMMLIVEYVNVRSEGRWRRWLAARRGSQYVVAALLGVTPGCLGAFLAVTLYTHGGLSLGAVVAAMIATSGDEAFVLLALAPKTALVLMALLFGLAVLTGAVVDVVAGRREAHPAVCGELELHPEDSAELFPQGRLLAQWRNCSAARGILTLALALFLLGAATGRLGPEEWNWVRVTLMLTAGVCLFIAATVPDHFLEEHLWRHVARKHAPRIFLWTFGALAVSEPLAELLKVSPAVQAHPWLLLAAACAVGLIPESGPHLIFVTLYVREAIPFAVLLANSVVQDGHGMLPLLAHSSRAFLKVKAINLAAGLVAGAAALGLGSHWQSLLPALLR
jgi:hypothetical protein